MRREHRKALREKVAAAKKAGQTKSQFAREHGLEPSQLSRLLAGTEPIGGTMAMRLQNIIGVDAREFLSTGGR